MGFYGNSYHYTAESFARVVLKNSGIGRYTADIVDSDFEFLKDGETVWIDAQQRSTGIGVESGNHWIKMAHAGDKFQIFHSEPATEHTFDIIPFDCTKDKPKDLISTRLDFNDYLKVPMIHYDNMGHVISGSEVAYYQMPTDPTKDFLDRMQAIDGKNEKGEDEEPLSGDSLKTQFLERMQAIDGKNEKGDDEEPPSGDSLKTSLTTKMDETLKSITDIEEELKEALKAQEDLIEAMEKAIEDASEASSNASMAVDAYKGLADRVGALERKI